MKCIETRNALEWCFSHSNIKSWSCTLSRVWSEIRAPESSVALALCWKIPLAKCVRFASSECLICKSKWLMARLLHDRQVKKLRKQAQPRSWNGDQNKTHRMSIWVTVRSRQSVLIGPVGPGVSNFQSGAGSMGRAAISKLLEWCKLGKLLASRQVLLPWGSAIGVCLDSGECLTNSPKARHDKGEIWSCLSEVQILPLHQTHLAEVVNGAPQTWFLDDLDPFENWCQVNDTVFRNGDSREVSTLNSRP